MRTKRVTVLPYDEAWRTAFEDIKKIIESAAGDLIIGVEHVGSTSVEGMFAKPCIDIDVVIADYSVFDELVCRLGELGYVHEGELGIKDRHAFKYTGGCELYSHHLYVCPEFSRELARHVAFRDYLRRSPEAANEYSTVKRRAAELFCDDIDKYIEYKSPCIERIYKICNPE